MNNSTNNYETMTDEALAALVMLNTITEPVYEDCSEDDYLSASKLERVFDFREVPVYNKPGLMYAVKHGPDGFKYQRKTGYRKVLLVGAVLADELKKRGFVNDDGTLSMDKLGECLRVSTEEVCSAVNKDYDVLLD